MPDKEQRFSGGHKPGMEHLKEFRCQQGQIDGGEEIGILDQWTVVQQGFPHADPFGGEIEKFTTPYNAYGRRDRRK